MKLGVVKNKVVVNPEEKYDGNATIMKHNTFSDEKPEFVVSVPHMIGVAAEEDRMATEHCAEVQEELQERADDATPSKKFLDEIDTIAAGEPRDYDWTHPAVDNMYTGKFILDESNASVRIRKIAESYAKTRVAEGTEKNKTLVVPSIVPQQKVTKKAEFPILVDINFDQEGLDFDDVYYSLVMNERGDITRGGGIYSDSGNYNWEDDLDIEAMVTKYMESDEAQKLIDKKVNNYMRNELRQAELNSYTPKSETEIRAEVEEEVRADKKVALKAKVHDEKKKSLGSSIELVPQITINTNPPCFYEGFKINGNVLAGKTISVKTAAVKGNSWINDWYDSDENLCEVDQPLDTRFAYSYLDENNFHCVQKIEPTEEFIVHNPNVYIVNGNTLTAYIASGKIENYSVESREELNKLQKIHTMKRKISNPEYQGSEDE